MKTKIILTITILFLLIFNQVSAQTIAVAPIKTYGLFATSSTGTKLTRLELIKLNKYAVLDEFDMNEIANIEKYDSCFGKNCLVEFGQALEVDYILSGNIDGLGNKIVVNLKIIDIKNGTIAQNKSVEFQNQETDLQRMIGIVLQLMHGIDVDPVLLKQLEFKNELITSNNVGRINNSGPRLGIAYTTGVLNEFVTRSENQGGLGIAPVVSNIGYQFEGQYIGTENFSALIECLVMFTGLEQGVFIPSVSLLHGFRFGKSGWEFAFGPSFSISKTSNGFFDTNNHFNKGSIYWSEKDFVNEGYDKNVLTEYNYEFSKQLDSRGNVTGTTRWIVGFGRTFRSGALNVPVNLFYSSQKGGGMIGFSAGFNIIRSKKSINQP